MSRQIDLDQDIFEYLKSEAEPFVDTPNTVLRRLLGIGDTIETAPAKPAAQNTTVSAAKHGNRTGRKKGSRSRVPRRTRAASGTLLPEEKYERPLLKVLADAGGQAPYRDVVEAVGRELKDQLLPADFESLNSGGIRWQSRLQFVRLRLIERGYLDKNAPRGIWGITDAGRTALQNVEGS